jgi:hypothetical protein
VLLVGLALSASAQGKAEPASAPSMLFFLVRVTNNYTEDDIKDTLEKGARAAGCTHDPIKVVKAPPEFFRQLAELAGLKEELDLLKSENDLDLQETSEPAIWKVRVVRQKHDGKEVTPKLVKLEVTYANAGKKEYVPVSEDSAREKKLTDYLALEYAGQYTLHSIPQDEPKSCAGTVTLGVAGPEKILKRDSWPRQQARIYAITLPNFQGDRQKLFDTVKERPKGEPNLVANPFSDVQLGRDYIFTLASMGGRLPGGERAYGKNKYVPEVATLTDRTVRRVWMLFPVPEEKVTAELAKYKDLNGAALSRAIRAAGPSEEKAEPNLEIGPRNELRRAEPRWIELVDKRGAGNNFSREITISDADKVLGQFPRAWQLLVWEFDNGIDPPEAIRLQDDKGRRTYLKEQQVEDWSKGLRRLIQEQKQSKPKP